MGLFDRIKRVFNAEANAVVDKTEDATKISEQILRELNVELAKAINGEAEIKANALKDKADLLKADENVIEWEKRVNKLLDRAETGDQDPQLTELSKTAASKYNDAVKAASKALEVSKLSTNQADAFEAKVKELQNKIEECKGKAHNIEARQRVADASLVINKSLSSSNIDGLVNTLDRMDEKVSTKEYTSTAYEQITSANISDASKIDALIGSTTVDETLAAFKAKRIKATN